MVIILAISAAFFWGLNAVIVRTGLQSGSPGTGVLIGQVVGLVASLAIASFTVSLDRLTSIAILYFVASGLMGPFIARIFLFAGIDRVGSSVASAVYQTKPLFAAAAAIVVLGEILTASIALATLLMVVGTIVISMEQSGGQLEKEWSTRDLLFPLMAGACFGVAHVLRKMGLNITPEPILGVTVQNAAGLVFLLLSSIVQKKGKWRGLRHRKTWLVFGSAGLASVVAQICLFCALDLGHVVVVSPLVSTEPFFVLLLVTLFLKGVEKVTWKIVLGAALIVAGTIGLSVT